MSVEKHISHLLFEHDCVIIPQFGGFVGNYKSAKLDRIQNKFTPPSKEISFNKNLVHNDGLLANRISVAENKSYNEANIFLKKYSENLKSTLRKGNKIEFPQVGVLFSDEHQNIQFDPDYSANFLIDSFGLSVFNSPAIKIPIKRTPAEIAEKPVAIAPVHREEIRIPSEKNSKEENAEEKSEPSLREKVSPVKFTDRKPVAEKQKIRVKKYLPYVAAALPILALLLWIPFNLEKIKTVGQKAKSINYSNLIPFTEKPAPVYTERKEFEISNLDTSASNPFLSLPDSVTATSISLLDDENKKIIVKLKDASVSYAAPPALPHSSTIFKFHIIGGCFEYHENAEKLVNRLRSEGFNSAIIDKHKGLFRVCFQSCRTRNEALEVLAQVKSSRDSAAWLLVK